MRLLEASTLVALNEVNLNGFHLLRPHLSPVQHNLRVEVLYFIEVNHLVALESLQKVEVNLQAGRNTHDSHDHAKAT